MHSLGHALTRLQTPFKVRTYNIVQLLISFMFIFTPYFLEQHAAKSREMSGSGQSGEFCPGGELSGGEMSGYQLTTACNVVVSGRS